MRCVFHRADAGLTAFTMLRLVPDAKDAGQG